MELSYKYDETRITLSETKSDTDIEFHLTLLDSNLKPQLEKVEKHFHENNIVTDVLVYVHKNHEYQIIVRTDFYEEFILQMFKQKLLLELKWL